MGQGEQKILNFVLYLSGALGVHAVVKTIEINVIFKSFLYSWTFSSRTIGTIITSIDTFLKSEIHDP